TEYSSNNQQPPEIKRRTFHNSSNTEREARTRFGTLPFLPQAEQLEQISTMRSGNGSVAPRRDQFRPQ
ncbi:unnamed protein product, partial [Rotaria magnacalcarata]